MRKITFGYDKSDYFTGFKLFDGQGTCVLEIGSFGYQTKEILLEAEDRIVGFRSQLYAANYAKHSSLVIVIGRRTA